MSSMKVALLRSTTLLDGSQGLTASSQAVVQSTVRRFCRHWSTFGIAAIVKVPRRQREAHLRPAVWRECDRAVSRLQCHAPVLVESQLQTLCHSPLLPSAPDAFVPSKFESTLPSPSSLSSAARPSEHTRGWPVNFLRSAVNAAVPRHTHAAVRMHHSLSANTWFLIAFVSREALGSQH